VGRHGDQAAAQRDHFANCLRVRGRPCMGYSPLTNGLLPIMVGDTMTCRHASCSVLRSDMGAHMPGIGELSRPERSGRDDGEGCRRARHDGEVGCYDNEMNAALMKATAPHPDRHANAPIGPSPLRTPEPAREAMSVPAKRRLTEM
jgi:hypothetical protein